MTRFFLAGGDSSSAARTSLGSAFRKYQRRLIFQMLPGVVTYDRPAAKAHVLALPRDDERAGYVGGTMDPSGGSRARMSAGRGARMA
jgi:hypothetical protein